MSFIAKNPLSAAKVKSSPPSPMKGMRGLFPGEDGWYDIDDNGNITKLGSNSEEGADGKSAYEIAVEQGFEGSEQEWLDSLKGEPGAPGEKGDKGADGQDGADGYSPVRGTDYWTPEDIAEIKGYVDDLFSVLVIDGILKLERKEG